MKLSPTLDLVRIQNNNWRLTNDMPFDIEWEYHFWSSSNCYVNMTVQCECNAMTKDNYLPIINFGYIVEIRLHNVRRMRFSTPENFSDQSGQSTMQYFDNRADRAIVFAFVVKNLKRYLKKYHPPFIIRGPILPVHKTLKRYEVIGDVIKSSGYEERIYKVADMSKGLRTVENNPCKPEDEIRMYAKSLELWAELEKGWKAL
ncbi:hypothetical protein [Sulfuricurvum sp.]|uniref:hypothetical protein n=1 Tax=Sulfuricurvum sp. TaxID=2025608 RepID=UPI003BB79EFA